MQSNAQKLWIPVPSAATITVGTVGTDFEGEVRIEDQISILAASVRKCDITCAAPCVENVWTIEFQAIDFGTCNPCGKSLGFKLFLQRHPDFDNQTYFEYNQQKLYMFQEPLIGVWTAIQLADWFENYINDLYNQNDQHDQFYIAVTNDGAGTLTITLPCSGLVAYQLQGIYNIPNSNLGTTEGPIFTEVTTSQEAVLSREKLLVQFPQEVGHVFGEAPRDQFMWCQTICVIKLKGCIDACSDFFDNQNSGHLHTGATPFDLLLYINSAAPGFAAFIEALNDAFTVCELTDAPGFQSGVQALYNAGGTVIDISSLVFDPAGTVFVIQSGAIRLTVTATSAANLVAEINAAMGNASTSQAAPNITFLAGALPLLNAFAAGSFITISPFSYTNYVGE